MKYEKISFPKDSLPHNTIIEWWYFNGHLKDEGGREYSFMDCFFRADATKVKIPLISRIPSKYVHFAHAILSDIRSRKSYFDINPIAIISEDSFSKQLFFVNYTFPSMKGYLNYEIDETAPFNYRIKSRSFDLVLESTKKPLLEGSKGFLDLNSKQTYYYTLTNMKTEGWVMLDGRRTRVTGKSWMDHQWADVAYSRDKWSWFSIQLDNDVEMVCYEYDDGKKKSYLASLVDSKGRESHTNNVIIAPGSEVWESHETGARYPVSWKIAVPSFDIFLDISAIIKEQEVLFSTINYWEGPVNVKGSMGKKQVRGKGFMELASYPMNKSLLKVYRRRITKSFMDELSQARKKFLSK